jgi:hypothetical protein
VYFFVASITVGGGVVRWSMQVTIPLSQPGGFEVAGTTSQAHTAIEASASSRVRFTL